jgi:hypothetical protein
VLPVVRGSLFRKARGTPKDPLTSESGVSIWVSLFSRQFSNQTGESILMKCYFLIDAA